MDQVVCDFTPMFICNPYSTPGMTYDQATAALQDAVADPAMRRRQIEMRRGGGGDGQYSPGNYGFLDNPTLGNGANALRDAIAMESPSACFKQSGVDTKPGFVASVRDAVNVRFDLYEHSMSSAKNDPNMRPAMNVRKGYLQASGAACSAAPCHTNSVIPVSLRPWVCRGIIAFASTCPYMGGRMGDGDLGFRQLLDSEPHLAHRGRAADNRRVNGAPASNTNLPSRYEVYLYEIAQRRRRSSTNPSGQAASVSPGQGRKRGLPSASPTASTDPDRRTFFAAIVNCDANLPP